MANAYKISKESLNKFIENAAKQFEVWAPVKNTGDVAAGFSLRLIENAAEIESDFVRTTQSVKKVFHRPRALLFDYTGADGFNSKEEAPVKDIMAFGVHACDLRGVLLQDKVFADKESPNLYLERRKNAVIVALTCNKCDEFCFCGCMGAGPEAKEGFDLLLTDFGKEFLVETGTPRGEKLLANVDKKEAADADFAQKKDKLNSIMKELGKSCSVECSKMKEILQKNFEHAYWQNESDKCLSCGSCTNVCPTCFCYSIKDYLDWDGKTAKRETYWDSCQNKEFALVAMGENFRPERSARLKQFVNHKLNYWHDQFGSTGCVGCGRCIEACPAGISLLDIVEKISK